MIANTNPETGIRYGTVYMNELDPELWDMIYEGTNISYEAAREEAEAKLLAEHEGEEDFDLERHLDDWSESYEGYEENYKGTSRGGVKWILTWLGGAPMLTIVDSPFVDRFVFCSPCCPNAVSLTRHPSGDEEGYTIPKDWWNEEN
jgi:hypothetical protein